MGEVSDSQRRGKVKRRLQKNRCAKERNLENQNKEGKAR